MERKAPIGGQDNESLYVYTALSVFAELARNLYCCKGFQRVCLFIHMVQFFLLLGKAR
jgi:hypothetical protein